jgi:hypothetical protein
MLKILKMPDLLADPESERTVHRRGADIFGLPEYTPEDAFVSEETSPPLLRANGFETVRLPLPCRDETVCLLQHPCLLTPENSEGMSLFS